MTGNMFSLQCAREVKRKIPEQEMQKAKPQGSQKHPLQILTNAGVIL